MPPCNGTKSDCKLKHAARSLAFKEAAVLVGEERSESFCQRREKTHVLVLHSEGEYKSQNTHSLIIHEDKHK